MPKVVVDLRTATYNDLLVAAPSAVPDGGPYRLVLCVDKHHGNVADKGVANALVGMQFVVIPLK